jgi:hypothetical protein
MMLSPGHEELAPARCMVMARQRRIETDLMQRPPRGSLRLIQYDPMKSRLPIGTPLCRNSA